MKSISVCNSKIRECQSVIENSSKNVRTSVGAIRTVIKNLNFESASKEPIVNSINASLHDAEILCEGIGFMATQLSAIAELYMNTEREICEQYAGKQNAGNPKISIVKALKASSGMSAATMMAAKKGGKKSKIKTKIDSKVYDDEGSYGGNQGHPKYETEDYEKERLRKIIEKNTGHKFTDKEFDNYLKKLYTEGCGYVAIANTILVEFADHPKKFEKLFGYPLYGEDGDFNYDMLIADIYSKYDNTTLGVRNPLGDYNPLSDNMAPWKYDQWNDPKGKGTNVIQQKEYLYEFLKSKGVKVDTDIVVGMNPDKCAKYLNSGKQVIVNAHDIHLYDMDGSLNNDLKDHAMTVTGVTTDGKYIVSSLGKECIIDPSEAGFGGLDFMTVEYK